MLRFLYRWRYQRSQNARAFKLPSNQERGSDSSVDLGSYLSQASVRGRGFDRFDLPRKRRKSLWIILLLGFIAFIGWIGYESIAVLDLITN